LIMRIGLESPYYSNEEKTLQNDWNFIKNHESTIEMTNFAISDAKIEGSLRKLLMQPPVTMCKIMKNPDVEWFFQREDKIYGQKLRNANQHKTSFFSRIIGFFTGFFSLHPNFLVLGIENKEFGLKIGSSLGVLGNVIYNYKEKSLRIEKPLFFFKDKECLIDFFKKLYSSQQQKLFLMFLGTVGLVAFKLFQMMNKEDKPKNYFPGNEIYTNMDENLTCPNCRMKTKNVVLMPCKHLSLCEDCYYLLRDREKSRCPCCKQKFYDFFKIYIV